MQRMSNIAIKPTIAYCPNRQIRPTLALPVACLNRMLDGLSLILKSTEVSRKWKVYDR